jgi:heme-degrading monooxygenase HmoA
VTVVTVFRSRLRPGVDEEYAQLAQEMSRIVQTMEGFIDEKFYVAPDGERVTIVRFRDAESQRQWASQRDHSAAQERGRRDLYAWYDISVSEEKYASSFRTPGE